MTNEKIIEKMLRCVEKRKYDKLERLFSKNGNNEELWDNILLQNPDLIFRTPESITKLSTEIQKKIINVSPACIRYASDEVRNDRSYMEELQRKIDSREAKFTTSAYHSVYQYLGSKLSQDKEFLLSISDKDPSAFLRSMEKVQYDDETIKSFFDKHPRYVSSLPDNLKYNYDYAASLILRLSTYSDSVAFYCGTMRYEYLQNPKIKEAIIKATDEETYKKTLLNSLFQYPDQLKNISPEELKELIILNPIQFIGASDDLKSILSTEQYRMIQTIDNISKMLFKQIDTPQKLSNALFELSKSVSDGLPYENIFNQVNSNWQQILPWIKQIDEWHTMQDGSIVQNISPQGFYSIYNLLAAIEGNKLDQAFQVFFNAESRASAYGSGIKNVNITDDNLSFLQFACFYSFFGRDTSSMEMYSRLFSKISEWTSDPSESFGLIERIDSDINLKNLLLNTNIEALDQDLLINVFGYVTSNMNFISQITSLEELRDYSKFVETALTNFEANGFNEQKDKVLLKYFQIDSWMAERFIHAYLSSDNSSSLYQSMPEAKYLKDILEKITTASDIETIENIGKSLSNQNARVTFKDVHNIITNIKKSYGKEINSSLLQVNTPSGIIDATNIDFNLLVHVIGAYGSAPVGDIYDSWNTQEKTSVETICTSFISSNNMGIAPTDEHSVVLGFNNLPDDFLELMSCNDLYSRGLFAHRESRFLTSEELKNNTRHGHNELVIRRRKGAYTEEKVEPSYIICFDSVNEESQTAAQKFGVPIVFIDREKVAERHCSEIISLREQFKETLDPHLISKIICEQENNKAGLRIARPDLVEKYFSTEFRQKNIEELFSVISAGLNTNNPNAITAMNEFVKVIEREIQKCEITDETTHRKNNFDINCQEFLHTFKSNPAYRQDFELPKELTPEETYQKFIECRDRLAERERAELQYINNPKKGLEEASSSKKVGG